MPTAADLPDELDALARRHAVELSDSRWEYDVQQLIATIERTKPKSASGPPAGQEPRPRRRFPRRRAARLAGLVLLLAATAAAVALVAVRGGGGERNEDLAEGRNLSLQVFEAWSAGRLDEVGENQLSASARSALETLPREPILPLPPGPDDCYGEPGDMSCPFYYYGLDRYLRFDVFEEAGGMRVATVECVSGSGPVTLEACARTIRES